jgi:hypothetical protein
VPKPSTVDITQTSKGLVNDALSGQLGDGSSIGLRLIALLENGLIVLLSLEESVLEQVGVCTIICQPPILRARVDVAIVLTYSQSWRSG